MISPLLAHPNPEVISLQYQNLQELIFHSKSSRQFFYSLPAAIQSSLREQACYIHSALDLRMYTDTVVKYKHAVEISEMLF